MGSFTNTMERMLINNALGAESSSSGGVYAAGARYIGLSTGSASVETSGGLSWDRSDRDRVHPNRRGSGFCLWIPIRVQWY